MIVPIEDCEELVGLTLEVDNFAIPEEKAKRDTALFAESFEHLRCYPRVPPVRAIIWGTIAELRKNLVKIMGKVLDCVIEQDGALTEYARFVSNFECLRTHVPQLRHKLIS